MKHLVFGALAGLVVSSAVLIAPASAAPIPSTGSALATQTETGLVKVQMSMRGKMLMRRRMMMRERMMMRGQRRMMMKRRMMRRM